VFTGIVRERGIVVALDRTGGDLRLTVDAPMSAYDMDLGDSVSVSGACLTVAALDSNVISFDVVQETLSRTRLGELREGDAVNIEPALRGADQLGGHFVQGHVDGLGTVSSVEPEGAGKRVWVDAAPDILRYCVEKGSIAVDGVSLTIAQLADQGFAVALVPYTLKETTLDALQPGDEVNLEVDLLAKYVEKLVRTDGPGTIRRG
jgi:riboflavin synthase